MSHPGEGTRSIASLVELVSQATKEIDQRGRSIADGGEAVDGQVRGLLTDPQHYLTRFTEITDRVLPAPQERRHWGALRVGYKT